MKSASAKQKGRNLQKWVRDILIAFAGGRLLPDDVISRSSGSNGEDVILSTEARKIYPITIECKNRNRIALYKDYEQAEENSPNEDLVPVLVIKQNNSKPLAVIDAESLFALVKDCNG